MRRNWRPKLTLRTTIRVLADALMVSAALLIALMVRYIWLVGVEGAIADVTFREYARVYLGSVWFLVLVSVVVFAFSGFYTYGRIYKGRYKALVIGQAVSLSYLIFGFSAYIFRGTVIMPRGVYVIAWLLTLAFLIGARLWSTLWRAMIRTERHMLGPEPVDRKIRHVLVIGGAGYIGSALLPKLLDNGYRVRLLDLLMFGTEPIENMLDHPRLEVIKADFRQIDKVVEAMHGVDAVIHLGGIVGDPACALDENLTIEVNLTATRMIAEVAKGHGVNRFIFASTCSVYGASDEVLDERSTLNPVSLYARSKIASERVLMKMADERFAPVLLRFGTIFGLSGRTRFDLVVNLLTAKAITEGQITVFGGDQWRPFVHVDDAALAVLKALEAPLTLVRNRTFNVGSNSQNYTIQEVGAIIHRLVQPSELINMGSDTDRRNYKVNFSEIRNTLGFVPNWTVEQGVQQVIAAFQSGKIKDYRDARYSNVKFLGEEASSGLMSRESDWVNQLLNETSTVEA